MDEARRVLERLRRIELLDEEGARSEHILAEVRALLAEAEAWVRAEGAPTEEGLDSLDRLREALVGEPPPVAAGHSLS